MLAWSISIYLISMLDIFQASPAFLMLQRPLLQKQSELPVWGNIQIVFVDLNVSLAKLSLL